MEFDEVNNLMQGVGPSQDPYELHWLYNKIDELKPHVIMEIGSYYGGNLRVLSTLLSKEDDHLISLDYDKKDFLWDTNTLKIKFDYVIGDSHKTETLERIKKVLNGREIDFLYIDGDHSEKGTIQDYEMYSPLVRVGGMIGFHDITMDGEGQKNNCGVLKAWNQIPEPKYQMIKHPKAYGTGYFIKK